MREIKFRQPILNDDSSFRLWHYWGYIDGVFIGIVNPKAPSYQFTGLHDKKGKEIYEGDIVTCRVNKFEHNPDIRVMLQPITFEGGVFKVGDYCCWFCYQYEIIGNIHENPELLEH